MATETNPSLPDAPGTVRVRDITASLEVRDVSDDGRTLYGRVMPYGEVTRVDDGHGPYDETFERGAFSAATDPAVAGRVPMFTQHDYSRLPIGRGREFTETDDGLYGSFRISDTSEGRDAITLVTDNVVNSFSVGFKALESRQDGATTVRTRAQLRETSLVAWPAYKGALVQGVRMDPREIEEWFASLPEATRAALINMSAEVPDTPADFTTSVQRRIRALQVKGTI